MPTKKASKKSTKAVSKKNSPAKKNAGEGLFIGEIFRQSWQVLKKDWPTLLAAYAAVMVAAFVFSSYGEDYPLVSLVYFVFQLILGMVLAKVMILLSREEKVTMNVLAEVAPRVLNYLGGIILQGLIVIGGLILLILPGIIWGIKFSFAPYLIIDKGMGPLEALRESAEMTDGRKWDLVGFYLATMCLAYVGIFGLVIGLVVTLPLAGLAYAGMYNYLVERYKKN